jgi:membrane associated rhomboid family serine protease
VHIDDDHALLLAAGRPQLVDQVRRALDAERVPYRTGLLTGPRPNVVFSVPRSRLDEARAVVLASVDELTPSDLVASAPRFPWGPVRIVSAVVLLHFGIVFGMAASSDEGRALIEWGGLLRGGTLPEPWRLLTALFLHSGASHAFWNGVSLMVFAVPLLTELRFGRTCLIYLASGIGGGITALAFARPGTIIVGSSGAVAGLFGAWVVRTLARSRLEPLGRRARFRTLGIAMLVLPSLLTPVSSTGHPVSVSSHLGGLATGMAVGALISGGLLRRPRAG